MQKDCCIKMSENMFEEKKILEKNFRKKFEKMWLQSQSNSKMWKRKNQQANQM